MVTDLLPRLAVLLVAVPTSAAVFTYVFLFKTMAHMQQRLGPMEAGPHGAFQLIAEGLKFVQKEDLFPARADRLVFGLAPVVALVSTFLLFVVVPIGPGLAVAPIATGALWFVAAGGLAVVGVLMAGWGSANTYSLLGGLRAAAQLLAYEIPLVLAVLAVVVQAGTLDMNGIVEAQGATAWFVGPQIIGFLLFLTCAQAELTQAPFDMPIAESELVAGFMTEYSGFRFLLFFLSELATAAALAAGAATFFLGGWHLPFLELDGTLARTVGPLVVMAKTLAVGFIFFWVRFSVPRLREDQLQALAWKVLIPVALANLALTATLKVLL